MKNDSMSPLAPGIGARSELLRFLLAPALLACVLPLHAADPQALAAAEGSAASSAAQRDGSEAAVVVFNRTVTVFRASFLGVGEAHLRLAGAPVLHSERLFAIARLLVRVFSWSLLALVSYRWFSYVLGRFPYTRPWGENLDGYLVGVVRHVLGGIVSALPDLIIAAVVFPIAWGVTRAIVIASLHANIQDASTSTACRACRRTASTIRPLRRSCRGTIGTSRRRRRPNARRHRSRHGRPRRSTFPTYRFPVPLLAACVTGVHEPDGPPRPRANTGVRSTKVVQ